MLLHPAGHYDGWNVNRLSPSIGDIGYVVDILTAPGLPKNYVVEASDSDGVTAWIGDFAWGEIEAFSE